MMEQKKTGRRIVGKGAYVKRQGNEEETSGDKLVTASRKTSLKPYRLVCLCLLLLSTLALRSSRSDEKAPAHYIVTELKTPGKTPTARAVNAAGHVVGNFVLDNGEQHAFLYRDGQATDLKTLPGFPLSEVCALNDRDQVVGYVIREFVRPGPDRIPDREIRSVLWENDTLHDLSQTVLMGDRAVAINKGGQIARYFPAYLYSNGMVTRLARPSLAPNDPLTSLEPTALNDKGQIVGTWFPDFKRGRKAFWYDGAKVITLSALPGGDFSEATAINNRGQIVGISHTTNTPDHKLESHAFLYDGGRMTDLGSRFAYGINDAGVIVGKDFTGACCWIGGKQYLLDSLIPAGSGWHLSEAFGINASGQIVGSGTYKGQARAFLLTPIGSTAVRQR